jgi:amidase
MELSEYAAHDATGLSELLAAGEVSADELRETALRAIAEVDGELHAVAHGPFEEPPAHDPNGTFGGVPFAVKDLICVAEGYPMEFGSRMLEGVVAPFDSFLMSRFKAAGLSMVARTATPEFGFNCNTASVANGEPSRNPWDTGRIPGGSSGGSGALVAARAVPLAHANDGGGSIRIPAAWNGLVGLKPTRGLVSPGPAVGESLSGFGMELGVTRSVRDTARLLDAVKGPGPGDKYYVTPPDRPYLDDVGADPGELRIALQTTSFYGEPTDPEIVALVEETGRQLEALGHTVEPATGPFDEEPFFQMNKALWAWGMATTAFGLGELFGRMPTAENLEAATWASVERGVALTGLELGAAMAIQNEVGRAWGAFLDQYDVFLSPTLPVPAPPVGSFDQNDPSYDTLDKWFDAVFPTVNYTPVFNVTGQPSISVPLGESSDGLPLGVMLSAQALRDDTLIRVAAQLEQAMPWADRLPPVRAGGNTISA